MKLSIAQVQAIIDYIDAAIDRKLNEQDHSYDFLGTTNRKKAAEEVMLRLLITDATLS